MVFIGPPLAHFEAVIRSFARGLAEAERFGEESLLFVELTDRQHGAEEAAIGDVRADLARRPSGTRIARRLDDLEEESGRMAEADEVFAEALLDAAVVHVVPLEMSAQNVSEPLGTE